MKYKSYLTNSLECLLNEVEIGTFDTEAEAFKAARAEYEKRGYHIEPYTRGLLHPFGTFYDLGSYIHFIAVIPQE